jgi:transposase-like protein
MGTPSTVQEAIIYFSNFDRAFECARNLRWPTGIVACFRCGSEKLAFVRSRHIWHCLKCDRQFSVKTNTIFEGSSIGIDRWMLAIWLLCNSKDGVAPSDISRALCITPHSARSVLDRLNNAMYSNSDPKRPSNPTSAGPVVASRRVRGQRLLYQDSDRKG